VVSFTSDAVGYGRCVDGRLERCGVEHRGADTPQAFARRFRSLGLQASHVTAVLPLHECQLLQIEAPAVPAEELKSAARWRIKDLVDAHLDDLTLDVMVVGDGRARNQRQLFVVAAHTRAIREVSEWSQAAGLQLAVIDIRETAQRNLQTALAQLQGRAASASAALMQHGQQCLLTICAQGELFYARRLSWDASAFAGDVAAGGGTATHLSEPRVSEELAMLDIVDYGADARAGPSVAGDDAPRLVIELQRSLDLWERSWPDLPLDRVFVQVEEEHSQALVALLRKSLSLPIEFAQPEQVFADLGVRAGTPALRAAIVPLLGALLRTEPRQL
jgi:MSHA biogenesis protein MshI